MYGREGVRTEGGKESEKKNVSIVEWEMWHAVENVWVTSWKQSLNSITVGPG